MKQSRLHSQGLTWDSATTATHRAGRFILPALLCFMAFCFSCDMKMKGQNMAQRKRQLMRQQQKQQARDKQAAPRFCWCAVRIADQQDEEEVNQQLRKIYPKTARDHVDWSQLIAEGRRFQIIDSDGQVTYRGYFLGEWEAAGGYDPLRRLGGTVIMYSVNGGWNPLPEMKW